MAEFAARWPFSYATFTRTVTDYGRPKRKDRRTGKVEYEEVERQFWYPRDWVRLRAEVLVQMPGADRQARAWIYVLNGSRPLPPDMPLSSGLAGHEYRSTVRAGALAGR